MKKRFLNFAVLLLSGILGGAALGELVRIQVEKGGGIEAGYTGKCAEILDNGTNGVVCVRPRWVVEQEVHTYVVGSVTNTVTNWIRVERAAETNDLAVGDYVLPEDVLSTDGTNVVDVILEF